MMKHIALSQRVVIDEKTGECRDALDQQWSKLLGALDFVPVIVPNAGDTEKLLAALPIEGIILTGGNDTPERTTTEHRLIEYAQTEKMPLLGVCHGMQVLAQFFGAELKEVDNHVRQNHVLQILPSSRLEAVLSCLESVNSYHDHALKQLPGNFFQTAVSEDGVIEAMEHQTDPLYGIMWHPEREKPFSSAQLELMRTIFR